MRDLELWRRLVAGEPVTADELFALAAWPLARRAPYLGRIASLAEHADPAIRRAAMHVLAGARGAPGVRAIVCGLDDDIDDVRDSALTALRATARDAPARFAHAVFHPRAEIRRAAITGELSQATSELAIYLRADPDCADLAARVAFPANALALAFDFHAAGRLAASELVDIVLRASNADVRTVFETEQRRAAGAVDAYLDDASSVRAVAPGHDVLDAYVAALAATEGRALDQLVEVVTSKKDRALARRAAASLLSHLFAHGPDRWIAAMCVALEPRVLGFATFDPALADAATAGLTRFQWPIRPTPAQVERLLALPIVRADLALAVAVAGLLPSGRLKRLVAVLGEHTILASLRASDRGWAEICRLPAETPALELGWLARIERVDQARFIALAAGALVVVSGKRLDTLVDQLPGKLRQEALREALLRARTDERITVIGALIANRVGRGALADILAKLLDDDANAPLVLALVRAVPDKLLASGARLLDDDTAARFVAVLDGPNPPPRDRELAVAQALAERPDPAIRSWARRVGSFGTRRLIPLPVVRARRVLTAAERSLIASCPDGNLTKALEPALAAPVGGLVDSLAPRESKPSVAACAALLGCADPLDAVCRQLDRFAAATRQFDDDLDSRAMVWLRAIDLLPLAHARLFRWEAHTDALATWIDAVGGVLAALQIVDAQPGRLGPETLWRGISEVVMFFRYRDRERFAREASPSLADYCAERVDRDIGCHAARIVVALVEGGAIAVGHVRDRVLDRLADADADTRSYAARLVRLDGLPAPPPVRRTDPIDDVLAQIRATTDLYALVAWCGDPRALVVQEAAIQLVLGGAAGQARLAGLLPRLGDLASPLPILASIALWDDPDALRAARELAASGSLPNGWQFHLSLGLFACGDADELHRAFAAARAVPPGWYFRRDDWEALVRVADPLACAIALADAPHHHAYQRAIAILAQAAVSDDVGDALRRFLDVDSERPLDLRRKAARRLALSWDDAYGLPLIVEELIEETTSEALAVDALPGAAVPAAAEAIVSAALIGGFGACTEKRMWLLLQRMSATSLISRAQLAELHTRILEDASTDIRRAAAHHAVAELASNARLVRVAEVFAWGIRRGVELTGRMFRIHMTSKERELGHTYLDASRVFVSPLPMLRGDSHGRDVVEGLILHELGHHLYHRGEEAQALWKRAHAEGIGHLLNLIADEHLERNLRAVDPAYGDRLKRLDAYAFQHAPQEIPVASLLRALRGSAARALIASELGVAYDEASVRLRRGAVLGELDRTGHPLARFARALRMGLGNRHDDPRVAEALALCSRDLRQLDMAGLYELTVKIAQLFGGSISVCAVFGGPEGLEFGERDDDVFGGFDDDLLQREVERILDPRDGRSGTGGPVDRLAINVNPDEKFDLIRQVTRVRGDADTHRAIATSVNRHAIRLRAMLDDLGLRWEPAKARIQGRALDRSRLRSLVTRGDPRILIARTPVRRTDLFLGTVIDCSGSMQVGQNIDRARRFGVLVAEAVKPLPGVEARFFGFTSSVIYDAGSADDCGVVALKAEGGNNDAAALFHVANVAAASRHRARVLVMISDGLPTECSVAALRGLVRQLSRRRKIMCAQVAVRPLEEVCFPHYVVLDDHEPDVAVARFGRLIGELARRALAH